MMKIVFTLAVLFAVACAVPVAQLPATETAPAVAAAVPAEAVAVPAVAVAAPAASVDGPFPVIAPATVDSPAAAVAVPAVAVPAVDAASVTTFAASVDGPFSVNTDLETKQGDVEKLKQSALDQVMAFVAEMAQPMSSDEHKALKDIISTGSNILLEAEKKAREIHSKLEGMNLIQGESMFGIKEDGSIDADGAATQITSILSSLTSPSNPLSTEEKNVLHELISGFAKAFTPTKETTQALQTDFEKLTEQFTSKLGNIFQDMIPNAGSHDDLLNPQALLSVFNDEKNGFDSKMLTDLTEKFLDTMEKQFQ